MAPSDHQDHRQDQPAEPRGERRRDTEASNRERGTRTLFQRFRRPIIGLGLAGTAIPMVNATTPQNEEPADVPATDPNIATGNVADTEEQLAGRIAETREETERAQHIDEAVQKYDISEDLASDIYDIARQENIEPKLAYGLVKTESTFNERAVSHVGARGLTQVMPRTARWLVPGTSTEDLYNRQTNLRLGFRYLDQMIDKYKGDVRLALLAYNRGPGTVDKVIKKGGNPDNGYADKVLRG